MEFIVKVVERPTLDENGEPITKKGKPIADSNLRDTENVPMTDDIEQYFKREVLPYVPDAWIDTKKTKVGYEIPMTRVFYEYQTPEPLDDIKERISKIEEEISEGLQSLFREEA